MNSELDDQEAAHISAEQLSRAELEEVRADFEAIVREIDGPEVRVEWHSRMKPTVVFPRESAARVDAGARERAGRWPAESARWTASRYREAPAAESETEDGEPEANRAEEGEYEDDADEYEDATPPEEELEAGGAGAAAAAELRARIAERLREAEAAVAARLQLLAARGGAAGPARDGGRRPERRKGGDR
eukprot:tig00020554_g10868.t1